MNDRHDALTAIVERFLNGLAGGQLEEALSLLSPTIEQVEHPNAMKAAGDRRGIDQLRADADRGKALFAHQRYDIRDAVADGDRIAVRTRWTGQLVAGPSMTVDSAMFFEIRDGLIVSLENYDCVHAPAKG